MTRSTKMLLIAVFGLIGALLAQGASASTVGLTNATADLSQAGFPVTAAIDGTIAPSNGWAINPGEGSGHTAVFQTVSEPTFSLGSEFTFSMHQPNGALGGELLGRFRLSVTTGAAPTFGGSETWVQLVPISATSAGGGSTQTLAIQGDNSILLTTTAVVDGSDVIYTVVADTTLASITGFRIEALTDASLPNNGPGRANGNFVLSEFTATVTELPEPASLSLLAVGSLVVLRRSKRVRIA